jgi:hypothetical protein
MCLSTIYLQTLARHQYVAAKIPANVLGAEAVAPWKKAAKH